jgi:hypothetical protein
MIRSAGVLARNAARTAAVLLSLYRAQPLVGGL